VPREDDYHVVVFVEARIQGVVHKEVQIDKEVVASNEMVVLPLEVV
jgi:hypothetical protein